MDGTQAAIFVGGIIAFVIYIIFGCYAVLFEFNIEVPGIWGDFVRQLAKKRPKSTRAFVLFFWPFCLAVLIAFLPIEGVRGVYHMIVPEATPEPEPEPEPVLVTRRDKRRAKRCQKKKGRVHART